MTKRISINEISFFNNLIKDYLFNTDKLNSLIQFSPNLEGLKQASESKFKNYKNRTVLSEILDSNYHDIDIPNKIKENILALKNDALAITTAHQPCIFLGPLYIISKAISTIMLAKQMNLQNSKYNYIPIFVIGSEDHDKEEILNTTIFSQNFSWETNQTGAVGSMIVDKKFLNLLDLVCTKLGDSQNALYLKKIYTLAYKEGNTIANAMKIILTSLFGDEGLIVLDLNHKVVKNSMNSIFVKELNENIVYNQSLETISFLANNYKVQAIPRKINLFLLNNNNRVRIDDIKDLDLQTMEANNQQFSPNVMLRPLMQQSIIPSICNIGGAGEVAYWLEQKAVFKSLDIDFPVLALRDIFLIIDKKGLEYWDKIGLKLNDFFLSEHDLIKKIITSDSSLPTTINNSKTQIQNIIKELETIVKNVDGSLIASLGSLSASIENNFQGFEKKLFKVEKLNNEAKIQKVSTIQKKIFINNYLNERTENFSSYFIKEGFNLFEKMKSSTKLFNDTLVFLEF